MGLLPNPLSFLRKFSIGSQLTSSPRGSNSPQPAPLATRPCYLPVLEVLESRLAPAGFTTTALPLNNLTNLALSKYSLWVSGFSTASNLYLDSSGHFQNASGQSTIPVWN